MNIRVGTFNCQGLLNEQKKQFLIKDFINYKIDVLCIQETHNKETGFEEIISNETGKKFNLFNSGNGEKSVNGVGFLVENTKLVDFKPINDRVCQMKSRICGTKNNNSNNLVIINAYAYTLKKSEKDPELREKFYEKLDDIISKTSSRDSLIVCGDFNAIVGKEYIEEYNGIKGRYGKGEINKNGHSLIEFALRNKLILSNTIFKHKPAHITTWTCPERKNACIDSKSGTQRKNPYRNQIDFICVRKRSDIKISDSRSYGGTLVNSDHKMVRAIMTIGWPNHKETKGKPQINYEKLINKQFRLEYQKEAEDIFNSKNQPTSVQERWTKIVESSIEAASKVLGIKTKNNRIYNNPEISEMSEKQKLLKIKIENNTSNKEKYQMKIERNQIMNKIHEVLKKQKSENLDEKLKNIEKYADDSRRMFVAINEIKKFTKKKEGLIIETPSGGLTANKKEQSTIIADFFRKQFKKDVESITSIQPTAMRIPFNTREISQAISSLKNNRSAGKDNIRAELLKYGPVIYSVEIANLFNEVAEKGVFPEELVQGLITALQKPMKKKGPPENLRPITLLSMLRKIMANCLIKRIGPILQNAIPVTQAAYRPGRSTTEHIFCAKILTERASTSTTYKIHLLLHDMSKAFDSVDRNILLNELNNFIEPDELHLISILLQTQLQVRVGNELSEVFQTDTGVPQGDGFSAVEFTFYLARALKHIETYKHNIYEHNYGITIEQQIIAPKYEINNVIESNGQPKNDNVDIEMQYADDLTEVTTDYGIVEHVKETLPKVLKKSKLDINKSKTEEYTVKYKGNENWKDCKLLGSKLGTQKDIARRKGLTINAINDLQYIFKSKHISLQVKVRMFKVYVESIFLYNSELWTLTLNMKKKIDQFQRRLIRTHVLQVRYPRIIKNTEVYKITNIKSWCDTIEKRRLRWYGHLIRLPVNSPARKAYEICKLPTKRPKGRHTLTWMSMMKTQLQNINLTINKAEETAMDKIKWKQICNND